MSRAFLRDPGGVWTITDVSQRPFVPYQTTLSEGYTPDVLWVRLVLRPPPQGDQAVLRISQTFLDEVRLYAPDPNAPGGWQTRVVGDRHPYDTRDRPAIAPSFQVTVPPAGTTVYLRLHTGSASVLRVEALTPAQADGRDRQLDFLLAIFLGMMLWLLTVAAQDYALNRHRLSGYFALNQVVYIIHAFAASGYLAPLVPADWPELADWSVSVLICAINFTFVLFTRRLFLMYGPPRAWIVGLNLLLVAFPLELLAMALGHVQQALATNMVLILFSRIYFVLVALQLRPERTPRRRLLVAVYVITAALVITLLIPNLGVPLLFDTPLRESLGMLVNGLTASTLFLVLLLARSRELRRQADQTARDLMAAQHAFALEHALKETAEKQAQTDYLTGLLNRRHFSELAERELARMARFEHPGTLLMLDIDHFKSVNDTHGHATGDLVLQAVARTLEAALRTVDIVGRVGGEEFAVLLIATQGDAALEAAERVRSLVAAAEVTSEHGATVRVTVSIGVAPAHAGVMHVTDWLAEADKAMYAAKMSGRNRVRVAAA